MTDLRTQAIEAIAEAAPYSAMEWQCAGVLDALLDWLTNSDTAYYAVYDEYKTGGWRAVERLVRALRGNDD